MVRAQRREPIGCSGEPIPDPGEPIGNPFGAVPAPALRFACAVAGKPPGSLEFFSALLGVALEALLPVDDRLPVVVVWSVPPPVED